MSEDRSRVCVPELLLALTRTRRRFSLNNLESLEPQRPVENLKDLVLVWPKWGERYRGLIHHIGSLSASINSALSREIRYELIRIERVRAVEGFR